MQVACHTTAECSRSFHARWRAKRAGEPLPVHCTPQGTPQEGKRPLTSMMESSSSWNWLGSKIFSEMRSAGSASARASTTMNSMALDFLQSRGVEASVADRGLKAGHAPRHRTALHTSAPCPSPPSTSAHPSGSHPCTLHPLFPCPLCVTITVHIRASAVAQDTAPCAPRPPLTCECTPGGAWRHGCGTARTGSCTAGCGSGGRQGEGGHQVGCASRTGRHSQGVSRMRACKPTPIGSQFWAYAPPQPRNVNQQLCSPRCT